MTLPTALTASLKRGRLGGNDDRSGVGRGRGYRPCVETTPPGVFGPQDLLSSPLVLWEGDPLGRNLFTFFDVRTFGVEVGDLKTLRNPLPGLFLVLPVTGSLPGGVDGTVGSVKVRFLFHCRRKLWFQTDTARSFPFFSNPKFHELPKSMGRSRDPQTMCVPRSLQ